MFSDPASRPALAYPAATGAPLRVGMIGIGTVGLGTWRVLQRNQTAIAGRAGRPINIVAVAARNLTRAAQLLGDAPGVALTSDPLQLATRPDIDVLVEVAGGTGPAREWVLAAIAHGKHVVTANKALLAEHGNEIFAAAHQRGVAVAYEGAVAVSIPIVKALREGLAANQVEWVAGIVNGTTNFILTRMREGGLGFDGALAEAQALGYAEADPSFDVDGIDAAHKTALLAANAFGMPVRFSQAHVEGIRALQAVDVACAERLGYRVKLLGIARLQDAGVQLRVHPALVPADHLLAAVNGAMNGVLVKGDASGITMHYGAGAGSETTASAVIADLIDMARQTLDGRRPCVPGLAFHPRAQIDRPVLPMASVRTAHYLRVPLARREAMAELAAALGARGVTPVTMSVHVQPSGAHAGLHALIVTAPVADGVAQHAAGQLEGLSACCGPVARLRIERLD